jgi:uncharacterized RDD family membrane protein YckC
VAPNSYAEAALHEAQPALRGAPGLLPKAPLGARAVAKVIDYVVGIGPAVVAWGLFKATVRGAAENAVDGNAWPLVLPAVLLVVAAWGVWYVLTKDGNARGAGYGKRAMGLTVVHVGSKKPCSKGQSAIRQLVLHFMYLVPVLGWLTEPVTAFATAGGRRVGDFLAGTQVVSKGDWKGAAASSGLPA